MKKKYVIGVDLGGTKISTAISDKEAKIHSKCTLPTNAEEGDVAVLGRILETINNVILESNINKDEIEAIGIGTPGPLDSEKGIILDPVNLPFKNFNIKHALEKQFNLPVFIDNDGNAAALGEYMFGAGVGTKNMIYITVSTGVGGGAIINEKIYRGSTCNALEIGHISIIPDGPRCKCGNYGDLEVLCSGTAIARQAREALEQGLETSLKNYENPKSYDVYVESQKGDKVSLDILEKTFNYLGIGMANVVSIFDPDMIVIGGGVSNIGDMLFDKVREVIKSRCFKSMADNCKVVPVKLGTDAGLVGALALAIVESKQD